MIGRWLERRRQAQEKRDVERDVRRAKAATKLLRSIAASDLRSRMAISQLPLEK